MARRKKQPSEFEQLICRTILGISPDDRFSQKKLRASMAYIRECFPLIYEGLAIAHWLKYDHNNRIHAAVMAELYRGYSEWNSRY